MEGNLFAFALMGMVAVAASVVKLAGTRPNAKDVRMGLLLGILAYLALSILLPHHLCQRGEPISPIIVGVVCATAAYVFVSRKRLRASVTLGLLIAGSALTLWGVELVHRDGYVGNPDWPKEQLRLATLAKVEAVRIALSDETDDHASTILPEGWIEESWRNATGEELFELPPGHDIGAVTNYWHTWFTHIYRLDKRLFGVWCPGGSLARCIDKLELRAREIPSE